MRLHYGIANLRELISDALEDAYTPESIVSSLLWAIDASENDTADFSNRLRNRMMEALNTIKPGEM